MPQLKPNCIILKFVIICIEPSNYPEPYEQNPIFYLKINQHETSGHEHPEKQQNHIPILGKQVQHVKCAIQKFNG
jgi:hypothetical protein